MKHHLSVPKSCNVRVMKVSILGMCIALMGCNPAIGPVNGLFQDVAAGGRWDRNDRLDRKFANPQDVPRYIVRGDRLFLLTQVTQPHRLWVQIIETPAWTKDEVKDLARDHPDFRRYLSTRGWVHIRQASDPLRPHAGRMITQIYGG